MQIGKMDRRVTIERAGKGDDGFTAVDLPHLPLVTVWAQKRDISDAERVRAAEQGAEITTRFRVWQTVLTRTVTPKDRLVCEGRRYDITAVKEIGREALEIAGTARVDQEEAV